jgi:hypothetical protein
VEIFAELSDNGRLVPVTGRAPLSPPEYFDAILVSRVEARAVFCCFPLFSAVFSFPSGDSLGAMKGSIRIVAGFDICFFNEEGKS